MAALRSSTARALDAADGVIDGKFYGRPIVETSGLGGIEARRYGGYTGTYGSAYTSPLRRYEYASPVVSRAPYVSSTAAALDAADGVIDGKYFGRPIIETSGYPVYRGAPYPASASVTRYAGRYPAYSGAYSGAYSTFQPSASVLRRYPTYTSPASVTRYAGYPAYTTGAVTRYGGRYPTSASVSRVGPRRYYDDSNVSYGGRYLDGYKPASVTRYGYSDDLAYPRRYVDDALYAGSSRPAYRSSTALALDAADGVIDGRFYGRPIVEAPARRYAGYGSYGGYSSYGGSTLAERLDAADGVMDGKYFGRRIINV